MLAKSYETTVKNTDRKEEGTRVRRSSWFFEDGFGFDNEKIPQGDLKFKGCVWFRDPIEELTCLIYVPSLVFQ